MRKIFLMLLIGSLWITSSKLIAEDLAQAPETNFEPARPSSGDSSSSSERTPAPTPSPRATTSAPASTTPPSEVDRVSRDEVLRREEAQMLAQQLIENGLKLYYNGQYEEAISQLEQAIKVLPRAKATEIDYNRAIHGLTDSYTHLADAALHANDPVKAQQLAQKALDYDPHNRTASSILAKANDSAKLGKEPYPKQPIEADNSPEFLAKKDQIKKLFREGRILLNSGQFDEAEQKFRQVLLIDRYNDDAYALLDEVNKARIAFGENASGKARSALLWEVVEGWVPKVGSDVKVPALDLGATISANSMSEQKIKEKLKSIIFPEISFREAVISDVISFLSEESRKLDPEHVGVNIVLGGVTSQPVAPPPSPTSTAEGTPVPPPSSGSTNQTVQPITLNLRNVPMYDALNYIMQLTDLKMRYGPSAVIIVPSTSPDPEITMQIFKLNAGAFGDYVEPINFSSGGAALTSQVAQAGTQFAQQQQQGRTGGGGGGSQGFLALGTVRSSTLYARRSGDIQAFFTQAGVTWPTNSTLVYHEATSQLIVHNTPHNLALIDSILSSINRPPPQVMVEAKFVDISQSDLDELSFSWGIGGRNMGSLGINGGGPITPFGFPGGTAPTPGNVTSGLRENGSLQQNAIEALLTAAGFASSATPQGQVATISGILTDPQFSLVINAISQKSSVDLLSAPKVTVQSGKSAEIRIAQEFIYPTSYNPPTATAAGGGVNGGGAAAVTPSTPSSFSTREVGVVLDVLPTVGADGYSINLALVPEVTEFLGFINYGGPISLAAGNNVVTTQNDIKQPLFSSRAVATSVVIWDGQTVVLGGLIREDVTVINDKVPFLGDIPGVGRLFRSKTTSRTKRNLLMFVTCRLIDPAGNPVHRKDAAAVSVPYTP